MTKSSSTRRYQKIFRPTILPLNRVSIKAIHQTGCVHKKGCDLTLDQDRYWIRPEEAEASRS
ncbi:hypothetical protein C1H46_025587 [Malus baccata]|uniref:Uncharacterized protein n=1 Tax=Malus baccata TaxID=106549 RepID=A0A540LQS1_MALBA|nr:hypothetical protein C1H46_025587 [Malus baccata]